MRLIDADRLPYSNIKTNEYGYVETTKTVVLEEDIVHAQTVQAIPLEKVKQARESIVYPSGEDIEFSDYVKALNRTLQIIDNLIAEAESET